MEPETDSAREPDPKTEITDYTEIIGRALAPSRFGLPSLVLISLVLVVLTAYLAWPEIQNIVDWADKVPSRWVFAWFGVLVAAFAPMYVAIGAWAIIAPTLRAAGERKEKEALGELDRFEATIRGSTEPVDYAVYGRKALNAYYLMGQNQARQSFYIGVAAMIFGFIFLLSGLLVHVLDPTIIPYVRQDPKVQVIAVGGGLIIEFIAATFLWIYRAAIVQLTFYYKRQMLVHSSLIAVAMSTEMGDQRQAALLNIIDTMIMPHWEDTTEKQPEPRATKPGTAGTSPDG